MAVSFHLRSGEQLPSTAGELERCSLWKDRGGGNAEPPYQKRLRVPKGGTVILYKPNRDQLCKKRTSTQSLLEPEPDFFGMAAPRFHHLDPPTVNAAPAPPQETDAAHRTSDGN